LLRKSLGGRKKEYKKNAGFEHIGEPPSQHTSNGNKT
jgi:hypothetical protein